MMAKFEIAYKKTCGWEGFYSNDPNDTGGETLYGISRKHNPNWAGWSIVDNYKKKANFLSDMKADKQLPELAKSLYKKNYWDVLRLSELDNQAMAGRLYDICVNKGQLVALRFMNQLSYMDAKTVNNDMISYLNNEKNITTNLAYPHNDGLQESRNSTCR